MSYTKPCKKCGQKISLRQMPAGQWVAFDVSTEETHNCGIKNDPETSIKLKRKNLKKENEEDSFGISYDDNEDTLDNSKNNFAKTEDFSKKKNKKAETFYDTSGMHLCINQAIKEKKRLRISYHSEYKAESTEREISPIQKFKDNDRTYLQAYCHKRKSERIFLTRRIVYVKALDKDRTKTNIGKPNLKVDFSLD